MKALGCWVLLAIINPALIAVHRLVWLASLFGRPEARAKWAADRWHPPIRRFASRTTILRRAIDDALFQGARLKNLPAGKPLMVFNAADLRTGSALYFTQKDSGSWRVGRLADADTTLAQAVTASAAFPLVLPALDESLPFIRKDESRATERVTLADGGVYDNLGLAPLWPDRDPSISLNVEPVDTIIFCWAGYGLRHDPPSQFMIARLRSSFACTHDRAQNFAMKQLFDLREAGKLKGVLIPYLGQDDRRLKFPPADLVGREEAFVYPTDFFGMAPAWIDRLSRRGYQLTVALIREHAPDLIASQTTQ